MIRFCLLVEIKLALVTSHLKCSLIISLIFVSIPKSLNMFKRSSSCARHNRHIDVLAILIGWHLIFFLSLQICSMF